MHRWRQMRTPDEDGATDVRLQSVREGPAVSAACSARYGSRFGAAWACVVGSAARMSRHLILSWRGPSARGREIAVRRSAQAPQSRLASFAAAPHRERDCTAWSAVARGAFGRERSASVLSLVRLSPGDIPRLENVSAGSPLSALAFAAAITLATGIPLRPRRPTPR
jgi:hypothetical protein